ITAARELYVSDAFHKTFIKLDEEGTEAAAATAIIISLESAPPPATFTADRPFLFYIEHSSTGEMLFLGQVTNPA
ncbi:MAG: serpin family protein, partial [Acidimicrobiia bacterium]|nr:serpin family protein [Acidimicrobiia bacterium]